MKKYPCLQYLKINLELSELRVLKFLWFMIAYKYIMLYWGHDVFFFPKHQTSETKKVQTKASMIEQCVLNLSDSSISSKWILRENTDVTYMSSKQDLKYQPH